ncbi:6-phosphogluconolactonase [Nocardioides pantholopis]|uniref:6-phosphogluconolactonase n=1 Tax=Nocardioides pantholopis TaxID=2483798 RepID=UPI000F093D80|nr:6-phosphogluconolactonase [Nocardioides pantholopis]
MTAPLIEVHEDADALATAVAGELLARLAAAQADGRTPQIALTGGTVSRVVHREVARLSAGSTVDWSRVVVWWGDERFVAADDPERNCAQAREDFLDAVGAAPDRVFEVPSTADTDSVDAAAAAYDALLREHGAAELEVVMLGLGPDAHVASLFPGHPALDAAPDRLAVAVRESPKPPPERVSLTFEALNRARAVWFLVSGDGKADAVARVLAEPAPPREDAPAAGVHGREVTTWFLDRPAAARL